MRVERRWSAAWIGCLVACLPTANAGAEEPPAPPLHVDAWTEIGGGSVGFDDADQRADFEQYRDFPRGFFWDGLHLRFDRPDTPWYLQLDGIDLIQRDQRIGLEAGAPEQLQLRLDWDRTPHFFSDEAVTLLQLHEIHGRARFTDAASRAFLTANDPDPPTAATDAATADRIRTLLRTSERDKDLLVQRDDFGGAIEWTPLPDAPLRWTLRASGNRQTKDGTMARGTGTYERRSTPLGDTFTVLGLEQQEPVDRTTDRVAIASDFAGDPFRLSLQYDWLSFDEKVGGLHWDNPFTDTDELASSGGSLNRGRFAEAELDLYPDNRTHRIGASGSLQLPWEASFVGSLSYAWMQQDDAFLAYTRNRAILATNVPGTPVAADLARPQNDLDGDVRLLTQSYTLTSRAIEDVTLAGFYRYDQVDNQTDSILFPGYAAFGDSAWRTEISTIPPAAPEPVESRPPGYLKHNAGVDAVWKIARPVRAGAGYEYERWSRDEREVDHTGEHIGKAWVELRPLRWLRTRVDYRFGDRDASGYDPGDKEFSELRMYDQASRVRNEVRGALRVEPRDEISVGLTGRFTDEDYVDTTFGLRGTRGWSLGPELSWTPSEDVSVVAYYQHDDFEWDMQSVSKTGGATEDLIFNRSNRWRSETDDEADLAGVAVTWAVIPDRLFFDLAYDFADLTGEILTRNPTTIDPTAALSAQAFPFPDTESRLHEVSATTRYRLSENTDIGLRYLFSSYRLDDFQWNDLSPYLVGASQDDSTRYLLLDATFDDYDAHVAELFVTIRFGRE
jgi:MtrB/PioB family decaheme-associated outer membrane protein